jgi:hypothetical protein
VKASPLAALLLLATASLVAAAPQAGVAIPIPEALAPNTYELQINVHGIAMLQSAEARCQVGIQAGLPYGFEVGMDARLGGPTDAWGSDTALRGWDLRYDPDAEGWDEVWFNVKKQLWTETRIRPAVAVGLVNIGSQASPSFWFTTTKHLGRLGLGIGWSDAGHNDVPYELITWRWSPSTQLILEHTGSGSFSTNFAVERWVNDRLRVTAGYMRANNQFHDNSPFASVAYRSRF